MIMTAAIFSPTAGAAPRATRTLPGYARFRTIVKQSRRHGLWIAAWSVVGWVGTALAPFLTASPLILMLLSPRALFVALASDSASLVPFVLLGTLRLSVTDASYYIIGRKFPRGADEAPSTAPVSRMRARMRRLTFETDRLCRWFCARPRLAAAFLFVRPNGKYLGVAGAYGVRPWVAGLSATAGTAAFLAAMHVGVSAIF